MRSPNMTASLGDPCGVTGGALGDPLCETWGMPWATGGSLADPWGIPGDPWGSLADPWGIFDGPLGDPWGIIAGTLEGPPRDPCGTPGTKNAARIGVAGGGCLPW